LPFVITFFTVQQLPAVLLTPSVGQHPGPIGHRRLVPDMLPMAAGQIGHPIPIFILMISDDRLVHSHLNEQPDIACPL
jgi:hypothetical protein